MLPERFKEWALKELGEVKRAPAAFIILSVVCLVVGGWIVRWYDTDRVDLMEKEVESFQRGVPVAPRQPIQIEPNAALVVILVLVSIVCAVAVTSAIGNKKAVKVADEDADALRGLLQVGAQENSKLIDERDRALVALKDTKHEHAMQIFEGYSHLRLNGTGGTPRVTIRHASYGRDYELAQQIKGIFTEYVKWPANIEASNTLPRADKFKVVFDTGMTVFTYGQLVHAFSEGNLLGVTVGVDRFTDREDSEHLIVMVLPSAPIPSVSVALSFS